MPHELCCTGHSQAALHYYATSLATCPPSPSVFFSPLRPSVFPFPPHFLSASLQPLPAPQYACTLTHTHAHALPYLCSQTRLPRMSCHYSHFEWPGFTANEKRHAVPNHTTLTLPSGGCMSYFTPSKVMCIEGFDCKILD